MIKATKLRVGLCCAVAASVTTFLAMDHYLKSRLQVENESLRRQADELASLRTENESLSNQLSQASNSAASDQLNELLRLRGEVTALRAQTNELRRIKEVNQQLQAGLAEKARASTPNVSSNYLSRESWAFAGYDTPEAALQTISWAASNGDAKTFLESITPEMLKQIRDKGMDETLLQMALAEETSKFDGYQVLRQTVTGVDQMILDVSFDGDARQVKLARVQGQWKLAGPINFGSSEVTQQTSSP